MSDTTPSFFSRLNLGFSTLFALLSDPALAARLQALRAGLPSAPTAPVPAPVPAPAPTPVAPVLRIATPDAALQLLGLLQREARFVDFIREDMASYSDADIGAAARLVHAGCGKVLSEHFTLAPARSEAEGTRLVLEAGFDAASTRLTGNLLGQPPFRGVLRHPGWRVTEVRLPRLTEGHDAHILAAAEVEL
jgi:hypothetical protein